MNPNATKFAPQWQTCHAALDAGDHLAAIAADGKDSWTLNYSNSELASRKVEKYYIIWFANHIFCTK